MAYLSEIPLIQRDRRLPGDSQAIANYWPPWEQVAPQYVIPNPYNLALTGYRKDELVYACIELRANSVSEPPCKIVTGIGKDKKEISGAFSWLPEKRPNVEMGEVEFWRVSEIYTNIAGYCIWEKERDRMGRVINLWPLNPIYCSFLRGPNRPLRAVRYLYPGNEPWDIERENFIIFGEFDPIYPMVRFLSRSMVAMRSTGVHSSVTDVLKIFFDRGMISQLLISVPQQIKLKEAQQLGELWMEQHGGVGQSSKPLVMGQGATATQIQQTFREMAFADIDGRTESLICMTFGISPLLLAAKVGLSASTYSNYDQARSAYMERTVKPRWMWYQSEMTQQLMAETGEADDAYFEFDTSEVSELQEDEDKLWTRVDGALKQNLIYRDEARTKIGLDPVDKGEKVFLGVTVSGVTPPPEMAQVVIPGYKPPPPEPKPVPIIVAQGPGATTSTVPPEFANQTQTQPPPAPVAATTTTEQLKAWRTQALAQIGTGVGAPFDAELAACKSRTDVRRVFDTHWNGNGVEKSELILAVEELRKFNQLAGANVHEH